MSDNFFQNALLRNFLLGGYRLYARSLVGRTGPKIFINSIPKAGTHLVTSALGLVPGLMNSRLHLLTEELNLQRGVELFDGGGLAPFSLNRPEFDRQISALRNGQFASAHLPWDPAIPEALDKGAIRTMHVIRDPRDMLVSRLFYITGLKRHFLHAHLVEAYDTNEKRLEALLAGPSRQEDSQGGRFGAYRQTLLRFQPWLTAPQVMVVRFEDLVGPRGGVTTRERQLQVLALMCEHLHLPLSRAELEALATKLAGTSSPTLREGKAGGWRKHFTPALVSQMQDDCGPLLTAMGYDDW